MSVEYEFSQTAALKAAGLVEPEKGQRLLLEMAGIGVTDDDLLPFMPLLLEALRDSPDPDRALNSFVRWFDAVGARYTHLQTLLLHPSALNIFCLVTGCSQYFANLLIANPEYFEIIADPETHGEVKTRSRFYREVSSLVDACHRMELKRDALCRWKAREMLRIGVRDLAGLATLSATTREFSNLADACVQMALEIAYASHPLQPSLSSTHLPFCVIGMGKLGGQELNYSSDIDLMFVHGDDLPEELMSANGRRIETTVYLKQIGESLIELLSRNGANGHVFRVDMRLRPEGKFGVLSRSLASYRAYYESWAEGWERQALLKARVVAGDQELGHSFMKMVEPFVYRRQTLATFLDELRANKRRIEKNCELEGETETNIKTGYGGIRDIEFIVQLLQLEYGGLHRNLRVRGTITTLHRLKNAGLLNEIEEKELSDDYRFLRTLEHRLQLLHSFQTQTMPPQTDIRERRLLARRMGYASLQTFENDLAMRRSRTRAHLQTLFYSPGSIPDHSLELDVLPRWAMLAEMLENQDSPIISARIIELLQAAGFRNIPSAMSAIRMAMFGNDFGGMPPDTPQQFAKIAPMLFSLLEGSPDPDAGLAGIESLALAVPNRAQLYASFQDSPLMLQKMVQLASISPFLMKRLTRHLEWYDTILDEPEAPQSEESFAPQPPQTGLTTRMEESDARHPTPYTLHPIMGESYPRHPTPDTRHPAPDLLLRLQSAKTHDAKLGALARYYQREFLRTGAREIWQETDAEGTMTSLSRLADTMLQNLLTLCSDKLIASHSDPGFAKRVLNYTAILGLGKLGGEETGYASDWDILFVYSEEIADSRKERSDERYGLVTALVENILAASHTLATFGAEIEIDLRLRPWGKKGALIYSPHSLADYYRNTAETWERQAALKSRFITGNQVVGVRAVHILQAVSYGKGISPAEAEEIALMKQRIENERLKPEQRKLDLKLGYGGLSDIEWLAQKLQLENGAGNFSIRHSNTLRALSALSESGFLEHTDSVLLSDTYRLLTGARNGLWLQTGSGQDVLPNNVDRMRALAKRFKFYGDEITSPEEQFRIDLNRHTSEVRSIFQRLFYNAIRKAATDSAEV